MNTPIVSVIIPNYNHAQYLDERIQSILNQTYQDFEIIILDDKSTDNSKDIIEKYRNNPKVSNIVYNEKNNGSPFIQWKKGINLARGEYIWLAESDDSCKDTLLENLVKNIQKDKNCVLSFSRSMKIDRDGKELGLAIKGLDTDEFLSGQVFINKYMAKGCEVQNASSAIFRKNVLNKIDIDYTIYKASGDKFFWILIAEHGNVAITHTPLNLFRQHGDNTTKRTFLQGINQKENKLILDYIINKGYISKKQAIKSSFPFKKKFVYEFVFANKKTKHELIKLWDGNYYYYFKYLVSKFILTSKIKIYALTHSGH